MSDETIDLAGVVDEAAADLTHEKKAEVKKKIRHVFEQLTLFAEQKKRFTSELQKADEKHQKAAHKLEELRKGNWEILKQINPGQKEGSAEGSNE